MTKQHHKPCNTCPFTKKCAPTRAPGDSPVKVYVAQYFMPFQIPCHECVDHGNDNGDPEHGWKREAAKQAQCVGFAECRSGGGIAEFMPDEGGLLKQDYDPKPRYGAFKDIWDFYAYHSTLTRREALIEVHPKQVLAWCIEELLRAGRLDIQGSTNPSQDMMMANNATEIAEKSWKTAIDYEWDVDYD